MSDEAPQDNAPTDAPEPTFESVLASQEEPSDTPEPPTDDIVADDATPDSPADKPADEATDNDNPTDEPDKPSNDEVDVKSMSRRERSAYYRELGATTKQTVERAIDDVYQPQQVDEVRDQYLEQGYDDAQAMLLARDDVRQQKEQINEARAEIAELNMTLATEAMEVVNSIPWLDSRNKDTYDESSTNAATQLYEQLAISKDPRTGQIVDAKLTPTQFYSLIDRIRGSGAKQAEIKGQRAAEQQLASVMPASSVSNSKATDFNSMSVDQQRNYLRSKGHEF